MSIARLATVVMLCLGASYSAAQNGPDRFMLRGNVGGSAPLMRPESAPLAPSSGGMHTAPSQSFTLVQASELNRLKTLVELQEQKITLLEARIKELEGPSNGKD